MVCLLDFFFLTGRVIFFGFIFFLLFELLQEHLEKVAKGEKNREEPLDFGKLAKICLEQRESLTGEWLSFHFFATFFCFFAVLFLLLCSLGEK